MKKLIITEKDNNIRIATESPLTFEDVMNLSLSALLSMMNTITNNANTEHKQQVKEYLFDMFNMAASTLLANFAPEIDLRKDIQAEAILTLEDELLTRRAQEILNQNNKEVTPCSIL